MPRSHMRRHLLLTFCLAAGLLFFAAQSWSRLTTPTYMADIQDLANRAPLVFRGHVVAATVISPNSDPHQGIVVSVATIQVDRWYRGSGATQVSLRFAYPPFWAQGHNCIDFQPGEFWLVFAKTFATEAPGPFEMIDDCEGALPVSPLRGPNLQNSDWPQQMEADFTAGLIDPDPVNRISSIHRLGGLKLPSSRNALHRMIENGDEFESKWAVYAALRTGDISVLPNVHRLLCHGDSDLPELAIAEELKQIADPDAVNDLIAILRDSAGELTRDRALIALGENLKDRRAVPSLAAHLSDTDPYSRYNALNGMKNLTAEPSCSLPEGWTEADISPQISRCTIWWEQIGKFRDWN
jgi:HEAT repeats